MLAGEGSRPCDERAYERNETTGIYNIHMWGGGGEEGGAGRVMLEYTIGTKPLVCIYEYIWGSGLRKMQKCKNLYIFVENRTYTDYRV